MSLLLGEYIIMPLTKKLCKKCWENIPDNRWMESDKKRWNEGLIMCPIEYREGYRAFRYIIEEPPENCPFILEHILTSKGK